MSMGHHAGLTLIGASRKTLRKLAAMALSFPHIPHGISCLAVHLGGLFVETIPAG
jgi:hypothetical protein